MGNCSTVQGAELVLCDLEGWDGGDGREGQESGYMYTYVDYYLFGTAEAHTY